jgi:TRAP transporter TAXI family solute receptor
MVGLFGKRLGAKLLAGAVLCGLTAIAPAKAETKPVNLTIASFQQGSSWYVYAVNLSEILREVLPAGSTIDTPPIAGGLGNPALIGAKKAQLAFGMAVVGNWALQGKIGFKEPIPQLRALVGGWDEYFLVPMARGTGFKNDFGPYFKDVNPKARVTLLQRGSIGGFSGQQLLDLVGAGEKDLAAKGGGYEFGSFEMVKTRFANGTADIFIQVATRGHPSITEISYGTPVTFMQPSKEVLAKMTQEFGWETAMLPKGTFPGQNSDVELPATTTVLFASTDLPDDLAYTVVKNVCEKTDRIRAVHQALAKFDCANGVWKKDVTGLPLHPGAERYYKERGWLN